eukprot:TRINITY_DN104555_c0_g1_i1.p1 TRINITY_DN104555_c0_g1~~TRINITY_DN104555_c0_g1_i1.p1  ORF type:complete len:128 (+),score=5.48 TRINITY_DN104555_c0_g1_i1:29-385(+)
MKLLLLFCLGVGSMLAYPYHSVVREDYANPDCKGDPIFRSQHPFHTCFFVYKTWCGTYNYSLEKPNDVFYSVHNWGSKDCKAAKACSAPGLTEYFPSGRCFKEPKGTSIIYYLNKTRV